MSGWLGRKWCGLWGHNNLAVGEKGRWFLLCSNCGQRSAGWDIATADFQRPVTQRQLDQQALETFNELMDVELKLHGGG